MANKINGEATIGNVSKVAESGHVNIGGVWKPIVEAYDNIVGVWKSAWEANSIPVTITSAGDANNGYFTVSGTKYYAVGTYQFDVGAVLSFRVYGGNVTLNGTTVSSMGAQGYRTYKLTVAPDYSSVDIAFTSSSIMWNATITTNT